MKKIILFFIITSLSYTAQSFKDIDTATIPVQVNVFIIPTRQQLTIVNEQGIQQDSIVINHFLSPDFQGEDTSQATFYIQRGSGTDNEINLSDGNLNVTLERGDIPLGGDQNLALDSELTIERPETVVTNGTTKIENRVTSRIRKRENITLNANEEYSGDTSMTVIWKKN